MGGTCCREGEERFYLSLLPMMASALPFMLSHGLPQGHTGIAGLGLPLFPVNTLLFPWAPGSLGRAAVSDTKQRMGIPLLSLWQPLGRRAAAGCAGV